jgi:anti-sigma-K factor RskA
MMDHDAVAEISGAYALDAVTPEEMSAVEAHLANCDACRLMIAEMRGTVQLLPLACEIAEPSSDLKKRIADYARAELRAGGRIRRASTADPRAASRLRWWTAAAAAAVILGGFGYAVGTMSARAAAEANMAEMKREQSLAHATMDVERRRAAAVLADDKIVHSVVADIAHGKIWEMSGGSGNHWWHCVLAQPPGQRNATLVGMVPAAPHGMKYQAWIIHNGKVHRAGVLPTGVAMMDMPMPVESGDVVAFTMEPPGGSDKPTMPWVMQQVL